MVVQAAHAHPWTLPCSARSQRHHHVTARRWGSGEAQDGIVNGPAEICDLGSDDPGLIPSYGKIGALTLRTPTCRATPFCGNGIVDTWFGEDCDLGDSNGKQDVPCDIACHVIPPDFLDNP
jgi:hypothetical protein